MRNGLANGYATTDDPSDHYRYAGERDDDERHGRGVMWWDDGWRHDEFWGGTEHFDGLP